jgi:hypothetical protein
MSGSGNRSTGSRAVEFAKDVRGSALLLSGQYVCRDRPTECTDSHRRIQEYEDASNRQETTPNENEQESRSDYYCGKLFRRAGNHRNSNLLPPEEIGGTPRAKSERELGVDLCPGEQQLI